MDVVLDVVIIRLCIDSFLPLGLESAHLPRQYTWQPDVYNRNNTKQTKQYLLIWK